VYLEKIIYIIQFMSEFRRMILKVSSITNDVATIPTTNDHQDGSWLDTDIYIGELFLNVADDILQTRTDTGIVEVYGGVVGVDWGSISGTLSNQTDLQTALDTKQIELVSGTNIKTVNGTTILGSGDIVAGGKFVDGTDILDAVYTTGNVGIGTVTPSEALDVVGKISLNDGGNSVFVGESAGLNDDGTDNSNTGIGVNALQNNTTGANNVANGYQALRLNSTGVNNVANGTYALQNNTTGVNNVANGFQSLQNNTTGVNNVANGVSALQNNTTGGNNVANGLEALRLNTTGSNNVANGYQALKNNTTGSSNTANGYRALYLNINGANNTANGYESLYSNTTGANNVANGYQALRLNTTGGNNTANGKHTLYSNTTGSYNLANGQGALYSNTVGNSNVANGINALLNNTTGSSNVANGYASGRFISNGGSNQTGNNSLFLGNDTRPLNNGETNQIVIGHTAVGNGSNTVTLGNDLIVSTKLKGDVSISGALLDSDDETGTAGQILSSTGTGTDWIDSEDSTLINTLTIGVSRSLLLTDKNKNIENDNNITITIPLNSTVAFPIGTQIFFTKKAESMDFAVAGGVTLNSVDNLVDMGRINCGASLLKINTDTWNLIGELV